MLRLITLGRIELTDAHGRPIEAVLKRPKRLALLTWLAVGGPGSLRSRDTVIGLFWPDDSQARARQSLNQALYVLRQELGKDVVVSVGNDQIGIAADNLWCDAVALRSASASGDQRSAQAHYRGDFLPGFFLSDAPDFEKWLETERASLRRLASTSAWKLAEEAADTDDVETAAAAAVRSAELSLREEATVRRAIELLDGLGERARALDLYRDLEADLAEDLGTTPAPETQEVVARVRSREATPEVAAALEADAAVALASMRARASQAGGPASGGPGLHMDGPRLPAEPTGDFGTAAGSATPPRTSARLALLAIVALVAIALVAGLAWMLTRPADEMPALTFADPHLLIEPFDAFTGDERLTDIAGSITAGLAARLAEVDALDVLLVGDGTPPPADSAALAHEASLAGAAAPADARDWFIVRGRVMRDGERMRALVSLIDRPTGQVIASATIERVTDDPITFIDAATQDAARFTRAALGRELRERAWRASTNDVTAWRLLERAETDRREADALWARGAVTAADAALVHADSLLALAAQREPDWLPPLVVRAQVAYDRMWTSLMPPVMDRDLALTRLGEGLEHAEDAIAIDTAEARARELKGLLLYWSVILQPTTTDATVDAMEMAEHELRIAVSLDPRRAEAWRTLSAILMSNGRFDDGYYAAKQAYQSDAFLEAHHEILVRLFEGAFETRDDEGARRWCSELAEQFPGSSSAAQCALALLAWVDEPGPLAVERAEEIMDHSAFPEGHPVRPILELHAAIVMARVGEVDRAEAVVQRIHANAWTPEMIPLVVSINLALGRTDSAAALLRAYVSENPAARRGLLESRRYDALRQ